jgi:hypothetical protein
VGRLNVVVPAAQSSQVTRIVVLGQYWLLPIALTTTARFACGRRSAPRWSHRSARPASRSMQQRPTRFGERTRTLGFARERGPLNRRTRYTLARARRRFADDEPSHMRFTEAVRMRILNPEPGSALARARDYGMDLTLIVSALERSPEERLERGLQAARLIKGLRAAREASRRI